MAPQDVVDPGQKPFPSYFDWFMTRGEVVYSEIRATSFSFEIEGGLVPLDTLPAVTAP